jgi:hypothetical protein
MPSPIRSRANYSGKSDKGGEKRKIFLTDADIGVGDFVGKLGTVILGLVPGIYCL